MWTHLFLVCFVRALNGAPLVTSGITSWCITLNPNGTYTSVPIYSGDPTPVPLPDTGRYMWNAATGELALTDGDVFLTGQVCEDVILFSHGATSYVASVSNV